MYNSPLQWHESQFKNSSQGHIFYNGLHNVHNGPHNIHNGLHNVHNGMWYLLEVQVILLYGFEAVQGQVVMRLGERSLTLYTK